MRLARALAASAILVSGALAWGDEAPVRAFDLDSVIRELSSKDARVRADAAARVIDAGATAVESLARAGESLDAVAWQSFADKCEESGWRRYAVPLVAAAYTAPEPHRRRLLDLARRLNPDAGVDRTSGEIDAIVRKCLVESRGTECDHSLDEEVAILGRKAVPAILALLRASGDDVVDAEIASDALAPIAEAEDVPALRRLLLDGRTSVAKALGRLQARGVAPAAEALFDAVLAGRFDQRLAAALEGLSDRPRVAAAVRKWAAARGADLDDQERRWVAHLFAAIASRGDIATLEGWIAPSRDPSTLLALGEALARLGSKRGIDVLVRVTIEKRDGRPRAEGAGTEDRLSTVGFEDWQRMEATAVLRDLISVPTPGSDGGAAGSRDAGGTVPRWQDPKYSELDAVAEEIRAWWAASEARLSYETLSGKWRIDAD